MHLCLQAHEIEGSFYLLNIQGEAVFAVQEIGPICAEVVKLSKHPKADRLKVCQVRTDVETLQVSGSATCMGFMLMTQTQVHIAANALPHAKEARHCVVLTQVVTNAANVKEGMKVAFAVCLS